MNASLTQLLVHVDASERCEQRLDLARQLSIRHGAALAALYAVTPSYIALPTTPEVGPELAAAMLAIDDRKRQLARQRFEAAMAGSQESRPAATWSEITEPPVIGAFAQQALYADLLVLGQHDPDDPAASDLPSDFAEAVVAVSGKPALVVPYAGRFASAGERVVIAWKETREAARAVAAAIPLLQKAARVHVVSWQEADQESGEPCVRGPRLDLERYLQRHGVRANWHNYGEEPERLGDQLLSRVCDLEADLLVMGCYGHSRAREWVLGGSTRTVLRSMTLPVLMVH
ncbi:universal stress protein [Caenimonas terrae]|uniref:Universal stress protein n=1 Tax=Caenimonas terrae TaxID=696074 RepID=A0ABW0NG97_9BURK